MKVIKVKPSKKNKKSHQKTIYVSVIAVAVFGFMLYGASSLPTNASNSLPQLNVSVDGDVFQQDISNQKKASKKLKTFELESFVLLYESSILANTEALQGSTALSITGKPIVDNQIRTIAKQRGYKLTAKPQGPLQPYQDPLTGFVHLIQPSVYSDLVELVTKSREAKTPLIVTSAYQSIEDQSALFNNRLAQTLGENYEFLTEETRAQAIFQILRNTAPPGYSKHHTGYAVDFSCNDGSVDFVSSSCYSWLTDNNFYNAKKSSFIPSYPFGVSNLGPDPVPWKFLWINSDLLYN